MLGPKPYLSARELSELTPWSEQAIRTMVSRGILRLGFHYFKPTGRNSRPIFSWNAIVHYIEGHSQSGDCGETIRFSDGTFIDLHETEETAHRLLG